MIKDFENDYKAYAELKAAYNKAKEAGDEAGMQNAKNGYKTWEAGVIAKGDAYAKTYRLYAEARGRNNDYIDLNETFSHETEAQAIERLRSLGIERFTFSSTWSSAVKSAWEFVKAGCILEDMVEINSQYTAFMSEEYEKVPAYLFRIA